MAGQFVPVTGAVVGATLYFDGKLIARDQPFTLPEVAFMTADLNVSGTVTIPLMPLTENMEASATRTGVDLLAASMLTPEKKPIEYRWMQTCKMADGTEKYVECKAFLSGQTNKIPGFGLEVSSPSENEYTFTVYRYKLVIDGQQVLLIDKFAGLCEIMGKDYGKELNSFL